jgi:peptidoglycan LD-endopeptidase LytH
VSGRARRGAIAVACASLLVSCALRPREPDLCARGLVVPVAGVRPDDVPDTFASPRPGGRIHHALDIPAPRGTAVVAADAGVVLVLRRSPRGGLTLWASDADRTFAYYYAHLDHYRAGVRAGTVVARGDVLGYVGTTGNADRAGPHLHFQVLRVPDDGRWWHGEPVDPRACLARAP